MRILNALLLVSTLVSAAACTGANGDPEDARDGSFSGKADGFGISEGSPEALGVLRIVNELAEPELREDVGLASRTVAGIVEARAAATIATLVELDAIPYVGPTAFEKLLAFAQDNGYVEEQRYLLSYRYGKVGMQSVLTIRTDGFLEHTERASPGAPAVVKTEPGTAEGVSDLQLLITLAAAGSLEHSPGASATLGSASGTFVVYDTDNTEIPIQLIERDADGDLFLDVTLNTSLAADTLRNVVHLEVDHDMPN